MPFISAQHQHNFKVIMRRSICNHQNRIKTHHPKHLACFHQFSPLRQSCNQNHSTWLQLCNLTHRCGSHQSAKALNSALTHGGIFRLSRKTWLRLTTEKIHPPNNQRKVVEYRSSSTRIYPMFSKTRLVRITSVEWTSASSSLSKKSRTKLKTR